MNYSTKQGVHYARTNAYIIIMPALCSQSIRAANYAGILNAYLVHIRRLFLYLNVTVECSNRLTL